MFQQVGLFRRFINALIDLLIIKYVLLVLADSFLLYINPLIFDFPKKSDLDGFLALRWCLYVLLYYVPMEYFSGRTIGKLITNTKVIAENGAMPSFKSVLIRNLVRLIPFVDVLSFLGKRGFHDSMSETMVVSAKIPYILPVPVFQKEEAYTDEIKPNPVKTIGLPKWLLNLKFKRPQKRTQYIIYGIIGILFLTNPSLKAFKEYLGDTSYEYLSRKYNFFVFSFFKDGSEYYIGIAENFIKI
jgi:uncharacterized RDD family membrane protein YckC